MRCEIRSANPVVVVSTVVASFFVYVVRVIDPKLRPTNSRPLNIIKISSNLLQSCAE